MKHGKKEGGYSLVIVLFAIVFIMTITAVFMRGALSNAKQEHTVDKNNLTVVAAEAGVDYYTWELEKYFDVLKLKEYPEIRDAAIEYSRDHEKPIDFEKVQLDIANVLGEKMDKKIEEMIEKNETLLFAGYEHRLQKKLPFVVENYEGTELPLKISGVSLGSSNQEAIEDKSLDFEMVFLIPSLNNLADRDDPSIPSETPETGTDDEWLVIANPKSPRNPKLPEKVEGISKPSDSCPVILDINKKECYLINSQSSKFKLMNSSVFGNASFGSSVKADLYDSFLNINNLFTSKGITMQNSEMVAGSVLDEGITDFQGSSASIGSTFNSRGFNVQEGDISIGSKLTTAYLDLQDTKLSAGDIKSEQNFKATSSDITVTGSTEAKGTDFQNVAINVGGNYTGHGIFEAQKSDIKIGGKFTASNGSDLQNTNLEVLGDYDSRVKFDVKGSDIFVKGALTASNGSDLQHTNLKVLGDYKSSVKFKAQDSDIFIEGAVTAENSSDLQNVNMKISKSYTTSQILKAQNSRIYVKNNLIAKNKSELQDTKIFVGGDFSTSSTADWQGTTLNITGNITASTADLQNSYIKAGDFTTNPFLKASGGVISVNSINSDRADLQNVTVCVKDLNIRDLKYPGSKIYYSNRSNHTGTNIKQVPEEEFSKLCKIKDLPGGGDSEPGTPSLELPLVLPPTTIKVEEVTYN